ncbi:MAG: site-2 protease family protein [Actinomycetota bacterium]
MNIFVAILGLGLLVFVHEAGHFFTARAVGMTPRRFYIGFPPPLVRFKRKGIEYGIGTIPLGGYVKIPGMHRPAPSDLDTFLGPALAEAPNLLAPIERVKRCLADGDMDGARELIPELERAVSDASVSQHANKAARRGLSELKDGLGTDAYWRQKTWKKVIVIFAGPGTNLLFAIVLFTALYVIGSGGYRLGFSLETSKPIVHEVRADRPAGRMGLLAGDRIVRVNGVPVTSAQDVPPLIESSRGRPITITVRRAGRLIDLGPRSAQAEPSLSVPTAAWQSLRLTGVITKEIGSSLTRLVRGNRKEVSSPVGIVEGSSEALKQGTQTYFWVLGLLSLSLALLNLLPLLPLDGGHIAFSIIEGIRGRAVGREVYERVSAVGIALVLLLFFIGLSNDIGRLGGN